VRVDPGQLCQVILNLAVNARDAMPRGGTLTLETSEVERESTDGEVPSGRYILLTVSDTGTGMTPEIQARIFEPFFTTKSTGKGTGLGLSVADGIVKQSGGHITFDSAPGRGTTFKIYLPAVDDKCPAAPLQSVLSERVGGSETILLAEDEQRVRAMTAMTLETLGYRVLQAASGEEAMRLAEEAREKIDLLMTDVVMPGMSGRELADVLRARDPDLKVLFQSGYTGDVVLRHDNLHAEEAFLQKPYRLNALAKKVREVLEKRP
jgi:CheY-like chemotaxis protein